jgi:hypothetical protein
MTRWGSLSNGESRTVADLEGERDIMRRAAEGAPSHEVRYGAQPITPQLWNTGLTILTNKTRKKGEPVGAGLNLFYLDLEWSGFTGPGQPAGVIPKEDDQRPDTNKFDADGIILPWCSNSLEVRSKAIVVSQLADDLNTIQKQVLFLFQYYWDNAGYYLPGDFTSFSQRTSLGEGPSSGLALDFLFDPPGTLVARATTAY